MKKNIDQSPVLRKSRQQPIDGSNKQYRNQFVHPPQPLTIKSSPQLVKQSHETSVARAQKQIIQQIKKSPRIPCRAGLNSSEDVQLRTKKSERVN